HAGRGGEQAPNPGKRPTRIRKGALAVASGVYAARPSVLWGRWFSPDGSVVGSSSARHDSEASSSRAPLTLRLTGNYGAAASDRGGPPPGWEAPCGRCPSSRLAARMLV